MQRRSGYYGNRRSVKRNIAATRLERAVASIVLVGLLMFGVFLVGAAFYLVIEFFRLM